MKPYICPEHPEAQIKHEWTEERYVYGDGYPRGSGSRDHKYSCNDCGLELSAEPLNAKKEYEK